MNAKENHACFDRLAWGLRWMLSIQCFGYAAMLATPSHINSWLLPAWGDTCAGTVDATVASLLWLSGCALPVLGRANPHRAASSSFVGRIDTLLLIFVAAWAFSNAILSWQTNLEDKFHGTDPLGHAVRYVAPLTLLALWTGCGSPAKLEWILRLAVASTFVGHGLCAYWLQPGFIDLIVGTTDTFLGADWEVAEAREGFAIGVLPWIGHMDFAMAILILLPGKHLRAVALWMATWGFVTALSRMTAFGWERWPDLFIRVANGGIPLILWFHWKTLYRQKESQ